MRPLGVAAEEGDGAEVANGTSPLDPSDDGGPILNPDTDGDYLYDVDEAYHGTDPNNPDTDYDGLSDYDEVLIHVTNPLNGDTDGDGVGDGSEVAAGTNPGDPTSF